MSPFQLYPWYIYKQCDAMSRHTQQHPWQFPRLSQQKEKGNSLLQDKPHQTLLLNYPTCCNCWTQNVGGLPFFFPIYYHNRMATHLQHAVPNIVAISMMSSKVEFIWLDLELYSLYNKKLIWISFGLFSDCLLLKRKFNSFHLVNVTKTR